MAVATTSGVRDSYTDDEIRRRVISEMISWVQQTSAPLFLRLGWEHEKYMNFVNWKGRRMEWLRDEMPAQADALAANVGDTSTTVITVANGHRFRSGHIIQVGTENMYVNSRTGDTLNVRRGFQGTTAATHTSADVVTIIGIAKEEGANFVMGPTTTMDTLFNNTQIIEEGIEVTGTQQEIQDYGVPDTMAYHLSKLIGGNSMIGAKGRAGSLILKLADMAYHGVRFESGNLRTAGGLDTFIPAANQVGSTSTRLTRKLVEAELRKRVDAGAQPDLLVMNAAAKAEMSSWYEGPIRTTRTEERGGHKITVIESDFGDLELMYDYRCPAGRMYMLQSECVGWITFRPFTIKDIPELADASQKTVIGEYSFGVTKPEAHTKITFDVTKLGV
jgi:hypothetical protein